MTRRFAILLLLIAGLDATAQTARTSSGRVSPEGPYQSQVRLLEDSRELPEATAEELLRATQDAYGRALLLRQLAQRGIATGDTAAAIAYYEQALALDSLSPLAITQMQINLGQLYALAGRHADAIRLLEAAAAIAPFGDAGQIMTLANSYLQNGRPADAARRAVEAIAATGTPPADWTRFAAHAFRQAGEPAAAARWQRRVVDAEPDVVSHWIQLAALYRETGDEPRALATLQAAAMSGLPLGEADRMRLIQMHLDYGTPDLAVPWLERLAADSDDAQRWRWLGQTRLRAGDEAAALQALTRWAELDGTPAAWLEIGELAASLAETDRATAALRLASSSRATGAVRGRALLLLGQIEAGRGNLAAAKRAFGEAAGYGGVYRVATQWLDFLARSTPASTGTTAADPVTGETVVVELPAAPAAVARVEVKTVPSLRVYTASESTPSPRLTATALELVDELVRASRRERLEWTGPLHIVVTGNLLDDTREIDVRVAVPIRRVAPRRGQFGSGGLDAFRCAWQRYEGPWEGLAQAWRELHERTIAAGLEPTGEARQVVLHRGSSRSPAIVELQIGIL